MRFTGIPTRVPIAFIVQKDGFLLVEKEAQKWNTRVGRMVTIHRYFIKSGNSYVKHYFNTSTDGS